MTSAQHAKWIRSGMQWHLARPLVALRDRLRAYGYTCFDVGDTRHMDHVPPEDHTPYSETGWPGTTPYGWVTAIDVMPPGGGGLPSLQQLGAQLYADRQADVSGIGWLKYMNWEPDRNNGGNCWHDRWTPGHVRTSSGDRGHMHLSCRSDVTLSPEGDAYDPVARLRGAPAISSGEGEDMIYRDDETGGCYVPTADGPRQISDEAELARFTAAGLPMVHLPNFARVQYFCPVTAAAPATAPVTVELSGTDLEAAVAAVLKRTSGVTTFGVTA